MQAAFVTKPEEKTRQSSLTLSSTRQNDPAFAQQGVGAGLPLFLRHQVQTKVVVGSPIDPLELEADHVAASVVRGGAAQQIQGGAGERLQLKCGGCDGSHKCPACDEEEEMRVHAKSVDGAIRHSFSGSAALGGSRGIPLAGHVRNRIEPVLGTDLSHVRVHSDLSTQESARGLGAEAFTYQDHIWLGQNQSAEDVELMAHESAHVAQQTGVVQRKPDDTKQAEPAKKKSPTAADAPKLDMTPSKNGPPCACVVVVHNEEANARKTAQLMFENCSYNLALLNPDDHNREIKIPGQTGTVDPNSLFPKDVAEQCMDDEKSCRDFLSTKSATTDKDEIAKFLRIQFFLAMSACSNSFSLPVIALHNNAISDTAEYRKGKSTKGVADLKFDVDKDKKETGADKVAKMKELLTKKFGKKAEKKLVETKGQTNIFRWCASQDLSKCHIGDPDHPDNITWVTNQEDFNTLSKKDINVALQTDTAKSVGSESEGDLSTLFLILRDLYDDQLLELMWDEFMNFDSIDAWLNEWEMDDVRTAQDRLRYLNVETPGKRLSDQTDAERVRNYESIVEVLKAASLHCCGADPAAVGKNIQEGLKIPKEKAKK
jgi:hypothetical protein